MSVDTMSVDTLDSSPPTSCIGLASTCGADRTDNCCNSLAVSGGTFYRSYDLAGDPTSGNMTYPWHYRPKWPPTVRAAMKAWISYLPLCSGVNITVDVFIETGMR
jgi:hypothetical protein